MSQSDLVSQIIRSKRRTLGLEITSDARLIVRAPLKAPEYWIHRIVEQKRDWILQKQQIAKDKYSPVLKRQFVEGEEFLFLGASYKLRVVSQGRSPFEFTGSEFIIEEGSLPRAKVIFQRWYMHQAQTLLPSRVEIYSQLAGQPYQQISINSAKTRWGSCNSRKSLNFNWRLIMAPIVMIDYVIAHEVAHLQELNHSSRFWNKVQELVPDYRSREQWFKDNQHRLIL